MQIGFGQVRPLLFAGVALVLIVVASVMLQVAVGFGFGADEGRLNPKSQATGTVPMQHAADIALGFVGLIELAFASLTVKSGIATGFPHWLARGLLGLIVGARSNDSDDYGRPRVRFHAVTNSATRKHAEKLDFGFGLTPHCSSFRYWRLNKAAGAADASGKGIARDTTRSYDVGHGYASSGLFDRRLSNSQILKNKLLTIQIP